MRVSREHTLENIDDVMETFESSKQINRWKRVEEIISLLHGHTASFLPNRSPLAGNEKEVMEGFDELLSLTL